MTWTEYGDKAKLYSVGDRVGQFYLAPVVDFDLAVVDDLSSTERGAGGFGSTGR
jgi:dUTP pyrophosphatase